MPLPTHSFPGRPIRPTLASYYGTQGGTRTRRTYDLNVVRIPIPPPGHFPLPPERVGNNGSSNGPLTRPTYYVSLPPPGYNWYGWRDSNPQNSDFKSDMYTNSITSAYKGTSEKRESFQSTDQRILDYVQALFLSPTLRLVLNLVPLLRFELRELLLLREPTLPICPKGH